MIKSTLIYKYFKLYYKITTFNLLFGVSLSLMNVQITTLT